MLTNEQVEKLRTIIDARVEALSAEVHRDAARSRDESFGELAGAVGDSGDKAVADLISDLDNAELDRDLNELRGLEAAQERLVQGSYGTCADCGGEIAFDRLLARPGALRCVDCQQVYEKTYAQPPAPKL